MLFPTYTLQLGHVSSSNTLDWSSRDTCIDGGGPGYRFEKHEFPGENVWGTAVPWGKLVEPRNIFLTALERYPMQSPLSRTNTALFYTMWMDSKATLPPSCKKGSSLWPKFLSILHTAAKLGRSAHNLSVVLYFCGEYLVLQKTIADGTALTEQWIGLSFFRLVTFS